MKKWIPILFLWIGTCGSLLAQETFPRNDVQDKRSRAYAFTNATLYSSYDTRLEGATLLIRDGKVEAVGREVDVPDGYLTVDLEGKFIYPSFIDMYTTYGIDKPKSQSGGGWGGPAQIQSKTEGAYNANEAIKSEFNAAEAFKHNEKESKEWRKMGFGSVLSFRDDGLARGTSALVTLGDDTENELMLVPKVAAHYSFDKGTSQQNYPSSSMGYIALLRQTFLDAEWYEKLDPKPFIDLSLDAWIASQDLPQIFEANNWLDVLRADKIGEEFDVQYIIKASEDAYQQLEAIQKTEAALIVPLEFPDAYDVDDPIEAYQVTLSNMKHWELAPTNPAQLENAGITFALTAHGLKKKTDFWANVRKAIQHGLSEQMALKALTHNPAVLMQAEELVGSLKEGMVANFVITSGNIFEEQTRIYENWIQGKRYVITDMDAPDLAGNYVLAVNNASYELEITGDPGKQKAKISLPEDKEAKVKLSVEEGLVSMSFNPDPDDKSARDISLSGWVDGQNMAGSGQLANGTWTSWTAVYEDATDEDKAEGSESTSGSSQTLGDITYPLGAYGFRELPQTERILIRNATVWTLENAGVLENTDVLIDQGRIIQFGQNIKDADARVIDGTGKHLTPGIIDEHSHIAATSINDRATNSSMVRISDVIDSRDQEIYRALSGGVTAIQILHGSANPIGGQSALIKLRWGSTPEEMKIRDADGYIKFALGENVKQSRSSESTRYPQTRMGVEQVFVDAFQSALDYQKKWKAFEAGETSVQPRKDLAMETMLEIIRGERFISCHSYVQSEINMLMNVAERFGFRINTFTHILEGYKVADKMAEHGAGGSTFSDWWAYKWEVRYAIPYNSAIMAREGVVTAVNSDNASLMRRLNQEAAKAVKYGDLDEVEALKMAILNPAKLLHLDDRMGSIRVGKDADLVLWSDHPLSIYARAEKTLVDGAVYFDIEKDQQLKEEIREERARLVQKMRDAKAKGSSTQPASASFRHHWTCEDLDVYRGN